MSESNVLIINCPGQHSKKQRQACLDLMQNYLKDKDAGKILAFEIANRTGPHSELLSIVKEGVPLENFKSVKKNEKLRDIRKKFRDSFSGGRYAAAIIVSSWKNDDDFLNFLSEIGLELDDFDKGRIAFQPLVSIELLFGNDSPKKAKEICSFD